MMLDLQPEFRAYCARLPEMLVNGHEGEYVLMKAEQPTQFFPTLDAALNWAYQHFGPSGFFVKRVTEDQAAAHFTRDLGPCRP